MLITNFMPCKTIDNKKVEQKPFKKSLFNNTPSKDVFFKAAYSAKDLQNCKNFLTGLRNFVVKKEAVYKSAMDWAEKPQNKGGLFIFDRDGTLTDTGFNDIFLTENHKSIRDELLNFESPKNSDEDIVDLGRKIVNLRESYDSYSEKAISPAKDLIKNLEKNNIFYKIITGNYSSPKEIEENLIQEGFLNPQHGFPKEYLGIETNVSNKQQRFQQIEEEYKGKPIAYMGDASKDFPSADNSNPFCQKFLSEGPNSFLLPYAH